MGRKIKVISEPTLAEPHAAGASVQVLQPSLHDPFGLLYITWPCYWTIHVTAAVTGLKDLKLANARILELQIDKSNSRLISDIEFIRQLYTNGTRVITDIILAFEHIVLEIERIAKLPMIIHNTNLNERLVRASKSIQFSDIPASHSYERFAEMQTIRDAIMHPSEDNVYNVDWPKVPIAWIASNKCIVSCEHCIGLLLKLAEKWQIHKRNYEKPATVTVRRGIKSQHSTKKNR
jgi:hypothetical protein